LGISLKYTTPAWTEFATEGATLALHQSDAPAAVDPAGKVPAGRCRPGFSVPDLAAFHQRMTAHRVTCVQEPRLVFGTKLAQYLDPDGLVISVSEAPTGG